MGNSSLITFCFLVCVTLVLMSRVNTLSCPKCIKAEICLQDLSACKYGLTTDTCGCCDVCAMGIKESCGGIWDHGGRCAVGLVCNKNPVNWQLPGQCVKHSGSTESATGYSRNFNN